MARSIAGSVIQSGRIYQAGDEDALAKVLPAADIARLVEKGALTGDWLTPGEPMKNAPKVPLPAPGDEPTELGESAAPPAAEPESAPTAKPAKSARAATPAKKRGR